MQYINKHDKKFFKKEENTDFKAKMIYYTEIVCSISLNKMITTQRE